MVRVARLLAVLLSPTLGVVDQPLLTRLFSSGNSPSDITSIRAERGQHQAYFAKLHAARKQDGNAVKFGLKARQGEEPEDPEGRAFEVEIKKTSRRENKERRGSQNSRNKAKEKGDDVGKMSRDESQVMEKIEGKDKEDESGTVKMEKAGVVFGWTMLGTIVILMIVVGLSLSKDEAIRTYTIITADNVVAIFLAVLFFQAYDSTLDSLLPKEHKVWVAWLHAVIVLFMAYIIAWRLRDHTGALAIFCAAAAHYSSFCSMHAATTFLEHHFSSQIMWAFVGLLLILVLTGVIFVAMEVFRRRLGKGDEWQERIDDVSNDFGAMAAAVCWSLLVRAMIAGEYHHISTDGEGENEHSATERMLMLVYGLALIPVSAYVVHALSQVKLNPEDNWYYWKNRSIMFVTAFFCMSIAWAFLLWGEWQFEASVGEGGFEITNKVMFAMGATLATAVGILALAQLHKAQGKRFNHVRRVALTAMSLVVGWSWEESFDAAIEVIAEDAKSDACYYKIAIAMGLSSIMIPIYAMYLKPYALQCEEAHEKEDDQEDAEPEASKP